MGHDPRDLAILSIRKRIEEIELKASTRADDEGLARRLTGASTEEALALVEWLDFLDPHGPLVENALCALVDRGDDALTIAILHGVTIGDASSPLGVRAASMIDSKSPLVCAAAIGSYFTGGMLPEPLRDKIAALAAHPDRGVRISVAYAVGRVRPAVAVALLDDPDDEVRYAAVYALMGLKKYVPRAEQAAERLVRDRTARPEMRLMAADIFRAEAQRRASRERLAREGLCDAPRPGERCHSGAPRLEDDLN